MVDMVGDLILGNIIESARLGVSVVLCINRLAQDVLAAQTRPDDNYALNMVLLTRQWI